MKRVLTDNKIVQIETVVTEYDRVVSFDDILDSVSVDYDDWHNESPWESCDGWDHSIKSIESFDGADLDDLRECRGYVRGEQYTNGHIISIDDDDIINRWGCNGYPGASKQVRAELTAQVKRNALDQLVKWYKDGWSWYSVQGEYNGYSASLGGVDCLDYADEVRTEIAEEIADQMEADDYIVEDRPPAQPAQTAVDRYRQRKKESYNPGNRGGYSKRHKQYLREKCDELLNRVA